tara:strand:- start:16890 stop:17519 length:630 start_codon:yes stop_codon:yes gene_type:complete
MSKYIHVLQTNLSNLQSINYAIDRLGYKVNQTTSINSLKSDDILVIPGVGNFKQAMQNIQPNLSTLKEKIRNNEIKILGICLGMQLLFSHSEEGNVNGLDIIKGNVEKLQKIGIKKVPNIGWRKVVFNEKEFLRFNGEYFYFVHSYFGNPENDKNTLGHMYINNNKISSFVTNEDSKIGNYIGTQFHPEKSGKVGLEFLELLLRKLDDL